MIKLKNILGLTILEGLVSTAIVGIGFIAILQMVNYSVQSIDNSGERTKANYLVSMMAEDVIGHRDSIYGIDSMVDKVQKQSESYVNAVSEDVEKCLFFLCLTTCCKHMQIEQ